MYEVFESKKSGKYYFRLKAKNGQPILQSEGYNNKQGCLNGVQSVSKNAAEEKRFEIRQAKDGREYFVLKAGNGEIIGKSQMYKSKSGVKTGIISVQSNAGGEVKEVEQ